MLEQIRRMFDYDSWANDKAIESIRSVPQPSEKLLGQLAHLLTSKRMWLGRIQSSADAGIDTWPQLNLEESVSLERRMRESWETFLAGLQESRLREVIHYQTAAGDPGMQAIGDVITHKFMHAMYHRGQIAALVRAEGGQPASTDFVVWCKAMRERAG